MRIQVKSRSGNAVIGVFGAVDLAAAAVLLAYEIVQTWGAFSLTEYAVGVVLASCVLTGMFFVSEAARNLGLPLRPREVLHHREGAAAAR